MMMMVVVMMMMMMMIMMMMMMINRLLFPIVAATHQLGQNLCFNLQRVHNPAARLLRSATSIPFGWFDIDSINIDIGIIINVDDKMNDFLQL